ncbi:MAG: amino acid permease [Polyangiaceae bacterium]
MGIWSKKTLSSLTEEANSDGHGTLKRVLGAMNLTMLGIGGIIGAGIFVLTGTAAAQYAGPSIVLSFVLAGLGCLFAGLCYSELASMIPVAGSAYTYAYATLGELVAWIIGWDLILEYLFGAATVAVGWSGYFDGLPIQSGPRPSGSVDAGTALRPRNTRDRGQSRGDPQRSGGAHRPYDVGSPRRGDPRVREIQ